jgi:tRNA uridine 5-carbamoylmethylation protein Kti12
MRIEMTGPPTAGKSRTVRELIKAGATRGPQGHSHSVPKKWVYFEKFIRETYAGTNYKALPDKTVRSLAACYVGDKSRQIMVFDEFLILCGFSMAIRLAEEPTTKYFETVPLPGILVHLTAPYDVLMARNEARGEKARPDKTTRMINAHEKYMPILERRGCRILTFDTSVKEPRKIAMVVLKAARKLR